MNRLILASLAFVALASGSALAADMGLPPQVYKVPPPPPPSWTGCYVNAGAGGGIWDSTNHLETFPGLAPVTTSFDSAGQGWLGVAGGGCDFQFRALNNWDVVVGAFGDYDLMDLHGDLEPSPGIVGEAAERAAWAGGLRAGLLVTPNLLTYVNAGYTGTHMGQVNLSSAILATPFSGADIASHDYSGWFVGGGTEYALDWGWLPIRGLFWRNEYRYSSYGYANQALVLTATGVPTGLATRADFSVQTITSSLVWRFNWTGP
jgi:outer membrane immunogenic protein